MKTDFRSQDSLYHPILMDVLEWLEDATGLEFTATSSYRDGDGGTHGTVPLRATDLRCHITSLGSAIELFVNSNWQYDPERPQMKVCIFHSVGAGGLHLHIQVHDRTERRK